MQSQENNASSIQKSGYGESSPFAMHALKVSASSPNPPEQLLFTESMLMDYVTLKGIENRFGVKREDIPVSILKELVDNALDHIELLCHKLASEIHIQINSNRDRITVIVTNPDVSSTFTFEKIRRIFEYSTFSSTKRNQYKISRGALGNGLKAALGWSYALATEHYGCDDWSPVRIKTGEKLYTIGLKVDKINRKNGPISPDIKCEKNQGHNISYTTVEIDIPVDGNSNPEILNKLLRSLKSYAILNPHITIKIVTNGKHYSLPAVQKIKSDWNNLDSIYHYSYQEFENLITSLGTDTITLYDFVFSMRLSEASKLNKKGWDIPIFKVQNDKSIIRKLYGRLMEIMDSKEKLDLPYDMRVKPRKEAIIKRLQQLGIQVENIKYQFYNGASDPRYSHGKVRFAYFFEVAEVKTVSHRHEIISGINSSPAKLASMDNPLNFEWISRGKNWNTNWIRVILEEDCGYSRDFSKFRKPNSIVLMHLVSPRIDWQGYGKSQIDFSPFSNLGSIIHNVCKGGIRETRATRVTQRAILIEFLMQRQKDIQKDPNLIVIDRWNPSDVWYGCRPRLLENGIKITTSTRSNFTASIRNICDEHLHINMEDLGIFAADRAQLYFLGHWHDVGFDEMHTLKLKGTDLIIIEKEGITEGLAPYTDKVGIALLFTRGFATKYVRDLSELSMNSGCNVVVLSDYDDSGVLLASKLKVPRLGIDPKTLEYFRLKRQNVEERYTPKNHLNSIRGLVSEQEFEYLSAKRIEINSVKTRVGTEKLSKWIICRLKELYPNRNYNRAIVVPTLVKPDDLKNAYTKIEEKLKNWIKPSSESEIKALTKVEGFIDDVPGKQIEIEKRLKGKVTSNPKYQNFICSLNGLIDSDPFVSED